jgi:hypothetical protein
MEKKRGGPRLNSGRKSKEEEQHIVETLKPYDELALMKLSEAIEQGKDWAIKLFYNYRYGMPKQIIDQKTELNFPKIDMNEWK